MLERCWQVAGEVLKRCWRGARELLGRCWGQRCWIGTGEVLVEYRREVEVAGGVAVEALGR